MDYDPLKNRKRDVKNMRAGAEAGGEGGRRGGGGREGREGR